MNIFVATPISSFKDPKELNNYKKTIINFISRLKEKHNTYNELETINTVADYDNPASSVTLDLEAIKKCDVFILHYPKSIPTSALVELGMAMATGKHIIIITPDKIKLPYLSLGISAITEKSTIVKSDTLSDKCINEVLSILQQL